VDRRHFMRMVAAAGVPLVAGTLPVRTLAQDFPNPGGDELYTPSVGQPGKDVVWVPTPDALVRRMLEVAKVTDRDLLFDLGAGDGKIAIAAARLFGATAKGIEYNPDMAELARRNVQRAGVADKVEIITGDIFDAKLQERFMKADVITMYLLPDLNLRLRPSLLRMRPGTRVVSHAFTMAEWEPDDAFRIDNRDAYYWLVPANVQGRWTLRDDTGWTADVELTQRFQRVGGTMSLRGKTQLLLGPYLSGDVLGFTFVDAEENVRSLRGTVRGDSLEGALRSARVATKVRGERNAQA
jgi:SAM-dependent methyltransferase